MVKDMNLRKLKGTVYSLGEEEGRTLDDPVAHLGWYVFRVRNIQLVVEQNTERLYQ